jgi:hypothetical protein
VDQSSFYRKLGRMPVEVSQALLRRGKHMIPQKRERGGLALPFDSSNH